MEREFFNRVRNHPKYHELVQKRGRFTTWLSFLTLVLYYAFIAVLAFNPGLLGIPLMAGHITTVGIPVGVLIIVLSFVLTGIYVRRANSEFDELTRQIKEETR
ncbi:MAG: DUF485 domain-containing protein [Magnetococcales bacterium]|nr:DUF485 domain-containing protein [Magnetococcales bacterium]